MDRSPPAEDQIREAVKAFCFREEVELFILFGSGAIGRTHRGSDLDVALQFSRGKSVSRLQLIFELETILDPWTVDLVLLTPETPPLLLHEIFTKGKLMHEKSPGLFEQGRVRAWHLYVDSAPLRARLRQHVRQSVRRLTSVS